MKEERAQVKSKKRVADHGEVFTAEREVNAMLDLVKDETERIDSRFLEPACGDGNFLAEILRRKLKVVNRKYGKSLPDYEKYSVSALMNIYGVDILEDNVEDCRERLYNIWEKDYERAAKGKTDDEIKKVARFLLKRNILHGNVLTMEENNGVPIIFSEWSFVIDDKVKRRDFRLDKLLIQGQINKREKPYQFLLEQYLPEEGDSSSKENDQGWGIDEKTNEVISKPIKVYPLIDYREVYKVE